MSIKATELEKGSPIKFFKMSSQTDDGKNKYFVFFKRTDKSFHPIYKGLLGFNISSEGIKPEWVAITNQGVFGWDEINKVPQAYQKSVLKEVFQRYSKINSYDDVR